MYESSFNLRAARVLAGAIATCAALSGVFAITNSEKMEAQPVRQTFLALAGSAVAAQTIANMRRSQKAYRYGTGTDYSIAGQYMMADTLKSCALFNTVNLISGLTANPIGSMAMIGFHAGVAALNYGQSIASRKSADTELLRKIKAPGGYHFP